MPKFLWLDHGDNNKTEIIFLLTLIRPKMDLLNPTTLNKTKAGLKKPNVFY